MIVRVVLFGTLLVTVSAVQLRGPVEVGADSQTFVNTQSNGTSGQAAGATPALQPAAVYDQDYPVDMAQKTPQELRYQAQADYARAIQRLKGEAAEAEAARLEMEKQLKVLEAAKAAALQAEKDAARAKAEADALKAAAAKESGEAAAANSEAEGAKGVVSKETSELADAKKAYEDAKAAETAAQSKIAALKKKNAELCAEIKKLEGEQGEAIKSYEGTKGGASSKESQVLKAKADVDGANGIMAAEEKEAAQAELEAAQAKDALAKAEAKAKTMEDPAKLDALVAKEKEEYEMALETFKKEENDVKGAQRRVAQAKAALAKWETHSDAHSASSFLLPALALMSLFM